ncbi:MAG: P-loop NTPase fold protein [Verrucomicrobiota bacterium]
MSEQPANPNSHKPLTFADADKLALKPFCERLEKYLLVDFDYADGSLVTALDAGFGCGKTTFLEMWKNDLLVRRAGGAFVPMPVILNAWESDYCGDPLVAILAGLLKSLEQWKGADAPEKKEKTALRKSANKVAWIAAALTNDLVAKATGMNAVKALELAEKQTAPEKKPTPDFISLFEERKKSLDDLKEQMEEMFSGTTPKVFVFVDELDRCRPDYAVSYLETIKHVFNVKGMVFVLAVDLHHLEVSAKSLFGNDLVFTEYFRKFCHRTFHLPKPEQGPMQELLSEYVAKYVAITGMRTSRFRAVHTFNKDAAELAIGLQMTPRQIQEAFRIFGHLLSTEDEARSGNIVQGWSMGALFLCYLRINKNEFYQSIRHENHLCEDICTYLHAKLGFSNAEYWIMLYLSGISPERLQTIDPTLHLQKLGYSVDPPGLRQYLSGFYTFWNRSQNPLGILCLKIENAENLK